MHRWSDEYELSVGEMDWTPRTFRSREVFWKQNVNGKSPGHDSYAERQAAMWGSFAEHLAERFDEIQAKNPLPDAYRV